MIPPREMGFEKCKNSEEGRREGQGPVQVTQSQMWQELCQVVPKEQSTECQVHLTSKTELRICDFRNAD